MWSLLCQGVKDLFHLCSVAVFDALKDDSALLTANLNPHLHFTQPPIIENSLIRVTFRDHI